MRPTLETTTETGPHRQIVASLDAIVRDLVPADSVVLVVSKGDSRLLALSGAEGWHFPRADDGSYAGYYPANSAAAIIHLEALRARGADFLAFPGTSLWWLEHYTDFRKHLERRYAVLHSSAACQLYDLRASASNNSLKAQNRVEETVFSFIARFDREPSILDWNTGLELESHFPEHNVLSLPPGSDRLVYLDESIDIVATACDQPEYLHEAWRVAASAVMTVSKDNTGSISQLSTSWKADAGEPSPPLPKVSLVIRVAGGCANKNYLNILGETLPPVCDIEAILAGESLDADGSSESEPSRLLPNGIEVKYVEVDADYANMRNVAAHNATGEVIVFLDSDSVPLSGWLLSLLHSYRRFPTAGVIGGKVVLPDGRLYQAGGVLLSDASLLNFGHLDAVPDGPPYEYVRQVSYCSGGLLAVRRKAFEECGGFDSSFGNQDYADADLCFSVASRGYTVLYQPEIISIYSGHEGVGTDENGLLRDPSNADRLLEKWGAALEISPSPAELSLGSSWIGVEAQIARSGIAPL